MTQEERSHWSQLSMLDVLRPSPGWHATDVVLSTYSLDLVVLASTLLALTGRDKLDGGGSKVGLASAIEHFRHDSENRLAVLVQSGQIPIPRVNATVLALLDRFVTEVRRDQGYNSWHPKAVLARFACDNSKPGEQSIEWRLWIGSRNLSRDVSWDTGLVLTGMVGEKGDEVAGLPSMANALFKETGWNEKHKKHLMDELQRVGWKMPQEGRVEQVAWLDGKAQWRPTLFEAPDEVLVITPFFDLKAMGVIAEAAGPDVPRRLLTTQLELDRCLGGDRDKLSGWEVSCLDSSEQAEGAFVEPVAAGAVEDTATAEAWRSDDEEVMMGLHAKIIAQRKGECVRLLMGSANVTKRAWERNAELVVVLEGGPAFWSGLEALLAMANHAEFSSPVEDAGESTRQWLDQLRHKLCLLEMGQKLEGESVTLHADRAPASVLNTEEREAWEQLQVRLEVAPLTGGVTDYVHWPWTQQDVTLPLRAHTVVGDSEFLQFRLQCQPDPQQDEADPITLAWVQRVELRPAPGVERDRRILTGYLNPQQFMAWIHGLLEGYEADGEPWDSPSRSSGSSHKGNWRSVDTPTLESLLKAWQHDSASIERVAETLDRYLDAQVMKQHSHSESDRQWITMLDAFRNQLEQIKTVLGSRGG